MRRVLRLLFGSSPLAILAVVSPTLFAIALDFVMRARSLLDFPPLEILNYTGSTLAACGFIGGPLWLVSRLFLVEGRARMIARAGLVVFFGAVFAPFAFFAYGGQVLYYRVFHAYMGRDTVRLGVALRGTVGAWLSAWGGKVIVMAMAGIVITLVVAALVRRAAPALAKPWPIVPVLGFAGAAFCFWIDFVESRSLQAAPPDTCFLHSAVTAFRLRGVRAAGQTKGVSLRTPDPLPPIPTPEHRPNVVVVLTESVRADATCSDPRVCKSRFLDEVAAERMPLGKLTSQASGTFTACMVLWTGLAPDVDFATAHRAPIVWELARAVGYRTAYVTSQNLRYDDMSAFVKSAGIDEMASAVDFGETHDPHVGAPDERAIARAIDVATRAGESPFFALVQLSNTHWPYRVAPDLQPNAPHSEDPFGDLQALRNHYANSVLMQDRAVAGLVRALRALPRWDDTVVIFLSDHGEQFREHGGLYHLNTVFDEEVRVPGWILAGDRAITKEARAALATYVGRRTFSQDVHATILDLVGVLDARASLPEGDRITGRSLLRPYAGDPDALVATTSGVWDDDNPRWGVMRGELLLVGSTVHPWHCYDMRKDPRQVAPFAASDCAGLLDVAKRRYPNARVPPP
jgi:phosphoglycerol transferase MdoB-like AlkP superfamily enzyme